MFRGFLVLWRWNNDVTMKSSLRCQNRETKNVSPPHRTGSASRLLNALSKWMSKDVWWNEETPRVEERSSSHHNQHPWRSHLGPCRVSTYARRMLVSVVPTTAKMRVLIPANLISRTRRVVDLFEEKAFDFLQESWHTYNSQSTQYSTSEGFTECLNTPTRILLEKSHSIGLD